jgi:hypothetical protein
MSKKELFDRCYADIMLAQVLVSKMAGDDGKATTFDPAQVRELQDLTQSASCAATGLTGRHDGEEVR